MSSQPSIIDTIAKQSVSFSTGSRRFGVPTSESDWDICVLNCENAESRLLQLGFRHQKHDGSNEHIVEECHNLMCGDVNVILLTEPFYTAWRVATEAMAHVGGDLSQRTIRIRKFQAIRDGYLTAVRIGNEPEPFRGAL